MNSLQKTAEIPSLWEKVIISRWFYPYGLRKLGNICCGHKMFLKKIRDIFVPDTKFVSATMCPRLPGPLQHVKKFELCIGILCENFIPPLSN